MPAPHVAAGAQPYDCLLAPTKVQVLKEHAAIKAKPESVIRSLLEKTSRRSFYNLSKLDFAKLLAHIFHQRFPAQLR